jgi:hypothetical protein
MSRLKMESLNKSATAFTISKMLTNPTRYIKHLKMFQQSGIIRPS